MKKNIKISSNTIVKSVKQKAEAEEKGNYTFRLTKKIMNDFKSKCDKEDISMASALSEMIEQFNNS